MIPRWRILIVVVPEGRRGVRRASSEVLAAPPRDPATLAARLLRLGSEVRIIDQATEHLSCRVVAREARWWHADLVLFHAGGSDLADDPLPDDRPLRDLLKGQWPGAPKLMVGPLGRRYGSELLERHGSLDGVLHGPLGEELVGAFDADAVPGLQTRGGEAPTTGTDEDGDDDPLPAWQLLPLEAYPGRGARSDRVLTIGDRGLDVAATLAEVSHAAQRADAGFLAFEARDLGATPELAGEVARRMFGAAPGVTWGCRVRADHLDGRLALTLAQGACTEIVVTPPSSPEAPAQAPMDDPDREPLEAAVEAVRVAGMTGIALHVVGRPGHRAPILEGWQRWFAVRGISVRPHVRISHAGDRGPGEPRLADALARAGCWDNDLSPGDVERAVKRLRDPNAAPVGFAS
jgi:hypothetical protein